MKIIKQTLLRWVLGKTFYNDISWFMNDYKEIIKIRSVNVNDTEDYNRCVEDLNRIDELRECIDDCYL